MQSNEKKPEVIRFDFKQLPEYAGAQERQKQLVKENPFIKVSDSDTYAEAKKRRMALRKGRYELQEGEKLISKKINEFKKEVKDTTFKLIEITREHEEKQDEEVKRYEAEKQAEKEERERKEQERVDKIRETITAYREKISGDIKVMTLKTSESVKTELDNVQLDCEEFQQDFDHIRESLYEQYNDKKASLEEADRVRKDQERIDAEQKKLEEEREQMRKEREEMRRTQLKTIELEENADGNFSFGEKGTSGYLQLNWDVVKQETPEHFSETVARAQKEIQRIKQERKDAAKKAIEEAEKKAKDEEEKRRKYAERKNENDWRVDAVENIGFNFDFEKGQFVFESVTIPQSEVFVLTGQEIDRPFFDNEVLPQLQEIYNKEVKRIDALKPEKQRIIEQLDKINLPALELETLQSAYMEIKADLSEIIENYKEQIQSY